MLGVNSSVRSQGSLIHHCLLFVDSVIIMIFLLFSSQHILTAPIYVKEVENEIGRGKKG